MRPRDGRKVRLVRLCARARACGAHAARALGGRQASSFAWNEVISMPIRAHYLLLGALGGRQLEGTVQLDCPLSPEGGRLVARRREGEGR